MFRDYCLEVSLYLSQAYSFKKPHVPTSGKNVLIPLSSVVYDMCVGGAGGPNTWRSEDSVVVSVLSMSAGFQGIKLKTQAHTTSKRFGCVSCWGKELFESFSIA